MTQVVHTSQIALVIPARDEEAAIEAAMDSVERQTLQPDLRVVVDDRSVDRTAELVRQRLGWELWHTVGNTGRKAGALNQAWEKFDRILTDDDYLVTMDGDTVLAPDFVERAYEKHRREKAGGWALGGVCANLSGTTCDGALGVLQTMEYARAAVITRSRRGVVPVLAGAATMFSVEALRSVTRSRGQLYLPVLTEDYELTLALRRNGYLTMAPRDCRGQTALKRTLRELWAQRVRWYRGAFEVLHEYGFHPGTRTDIAWLTFSLWAAAMRWLFLVAIGATVITVGYLTFTPWLLVLFVVAVSLRVIQVRELGWKYMILAGLLVEELYYALFLEVVLWWSAYSALVQHGHRSW